MMKKSMWLILWISMVGLSLIASGCAKRETVKTGVASAPVAPMQKEVNPAPRTMQTPPPQVVQTPQPKPTTEAKAAPMVRPKEETMPKPKALSLSDLRIGFAFDDYSLSSKAEENLNKIAEWMKNHPGTRIQVQGNTCDIGTDEYNLALGDERAESAEKYLETMGVDSTRLSRISYGREKPRVPNTNEENRSMNRRDEFVAVK